MGFFKKISRGITKAVKQVKPKKIIKKAVDVHLKGAELLKIKEGAKIAAGKFLPPELSGVLGGSGAFDNVGQGFIEGFSEEPVQSLPAPTAPMSSRINANASVAKSPMMMSPNRRAFGVSAKEDKTKKMLMIGGGVGLGALLLIFLSQRGRQ